MKVSVGHAPVAPVSSRGHMKLLVNYLLCQPNDAY